MASVNWKKLTKQKAGAMKVHLGKSERVRNQHSNPDIKKTKSNLNLYIGCNDYEEAYKFMCKRVTEVDKLYPPKRLKRDRVICVSLECPCPEKIYQMGRSEEFFNGLHSIYQDFFGAENVHGSFVHYDEMHHYIDKGGTDQISLSHSHSLVSAYAEWTENGGEQRKGINGKHFEHRPRYNELNSLIHDYCRDTFGVDFLTGEKSKGKSVELLKKESQIAAKNRQIDELTRQEKDIRRNIAILYRQYDDSCENYSELSAEIAETEKVLQQLHRQAEQLDTYNLNRAERISACMQTSKKWKKRTNEAFESTVEKGNNHEIYGISTEQDNNRRAKQKQIDRD